MTGKGTYARQEQPSKGGRVGERSHRFTEDRGDVTQATERLGGCGDHTRREQNSQAGVVGSTTISSQQSRNCRENQHMSQGLTKWGRARCLPTSTERVWMMVECTPASSVGEDQDTRGSEAVLRRDKKFGWSGLPWPIQCW